MLGEEEGVTSVVRCNLGLGEKTLLSIWESTTWIWAKGWDRGKGGQGGGVRDRGGDRGGEDRVNMEYNHFQD